MRTINDRPYVIQIKVCTHLQTPIYLSLDLLLRGDTRHGNFNKMLAHFREVLIFRENKKKDLGLKSEVFFLARPRGFRTGFCGKVILTVRSTHRKTNKMLAHFREVRI